MDMNVLSWIAIVVQGAIVACLEYTEVTNNSTYCWPEAGYYITLFENDVGIPWDQAKQHCEDNGDSLLEIKSPSIQQHAVSLTVELNVSQTAWIGGSRLTDNTLRSLDAQRQLDNFTSVEEVQNEELNCVFAAMINKEIRYVMDNCDEKHGNHSVICKNDYSFPDMICLEEISLNDTCYVIANNSQSSDWFSAQNLCRWDLPGFDLFDDTDVDAMTSVLNHVGGTIWTGYFRKPWVWNYTEVITYFNWSPGVGDFNATDCMTIDKDGKWNHTDCHDNRRHHMCLKNMSFTDTPTTHMATEDGSSVPSQSNLPEGLPIYAGAAAGGLVLLVVIVIVVVCVVRKKNRKESTDSQHEVNHLESTPMQGRLPNNQQYEMVPDNFLSPLSSTDIDSVVPYAEFGGVAHPGTKPAAGDIDPNYDVAVAVSGDYSE